MPEKALAAKTTEVKKENPASYIQKAEHSPSAGSPAERILFLQRTIGNQAVQRLMRSGTLQAKLKIGAPGDIYEQEADRVAEQVMRKPQVPKGKAQVSGILQHISGISIHNTIFRSPASSEKEGRLYSLQELTVIENLKEEQIANYLQPLHLPEKIDAEGFKRVQGQKRSFQNKDTGELLRFESNGLLCLETITYEYDAKKNRNISKKIRTYFDKKGKLIETRTNKEYVIKRSELEQRFKQEEQREEEKRILKELAESEEPIVADKTMRDIWELSDPNKFWQTLNLDEGVTKQLVAFLKDIIEKIDTLKFDEALSREKQEKEDALNLKKIELGKAAMTNRKSIQAEISIIQKRINEINGLKKNFDHVTGWIKAVIASTDKEKEVYEKAGIKYKEEGYVLEAEEKIASGSAKQLCNVISYYLYGQATGKIEAGESFGDYFINEIKKGHIGLVKEKTKKEGVRKGIEGASLGSGSSALREQWGMYAMRGSPVSQDDWKAFDQSGVKLAISFQSTGGNKAPNHFLLIVKDKEGIWRNMDHTSTSFERRGGKTDPKKVYGLYFDENALREARKRLEMLMQELYPGGRLI